MYAGCRWLTPVTLATQEAAIRRISVQSQPGQIVRVTLSHQNQSQKQQKKTGRVAQGLKALSPNPQYCIKQKRERKKKKGML
jgi:hypothetical protein